MGLCQADPKVRNYCNEAQERLLMDPLAPDEGWYGGWLRMNLTSTVANGSVYVTTPREICRLIVLAVCQQPLHIRNGFYEYLQYGRGLQPKTCGPNCGTTFEAYERDNVVTLSSLLGTPQTIRMYPVDNRDGGKRVLIQGKDANGQVILTTDPGTGFSAPGEYVSLAFPFVDTVNTFSLINGLQKDETYGPIQFFQVDPTTGAEVALSSMEPTEGVASYRRYLLTSTPNSSLCCSANTTVTIEAEGRLDFIPVANETDYLTIPNVPALIEESMSLRFNRMDSTAAVEQSALHHQRALALLNGQLDKQFGKSNTAIKVPLFGTARKFVSFR